MLIRLFLAFTPIELKCLVFFLSFNLVFKCIFFFFCKVTKLQTLIVALSIKLNLITKIWLSIEQFFFLFCWTKLVKPLKLFLSTKNLIFTKTDKIELYIFDSTTKCYAFPKQRTALWILTKKQQISITLIFESNLLTTFHPFYISIVSRKLYENIMHLVFFLIWLGCFVFI